MFALLIAAFIIWNKKTEHQRKSAATKINLADETNV